MKMWWRFLCFFFFTKSAWPLTKESLLHIKKNILCYLYKNNQNSFLKKKRGVCEESMSIESTWSKSLKEIIN